MGAVLRTSEHEEVRDGDRRMATPPHSTALLEGVEEGVDEVQGTPKAWNVRESSLAVGQYEEIILAQGKQLDSKHDPNEQSPKISRMDQVGGRLPLRRHAHRNIGNCPLRIRTVGGVGGRRRDCPAPPTRFSGTSVRDRDHVDHFGMAASLTLGSSAARHCHASVKPEQEKRSGCRSV